MLRRLVSAFSCSSEPSGKSGRDFVSRALWLMFAISTAWAVYVFGSQYGSCRAHGSGELFCFVIALIFGWLEILFFIIGTVVKFLMLVLP
jgi:hypothetical protein